MSNISPEIAPGKDPGGPTFVDLVRDWVEQQPGHRWRVAEDRLRFMSAQYGWCEVAIIKEDHIQMGGLKIQAADPDFFKKMQALSHILIKTANWIMARGHYEDDQILLLLYKTIMKYMIGYKMEIRPEALKAISEALLPEAYKAISEDEPVD